MGMRADWVYRRGDLYLANLNPFKGSEQGGKRPVLVLQNNTGNLHSSTIIVATITSQEKKKGQPTHYPLPPVGRLKMASVVQLEQIRTIDKCRVLEYLGKVPAENMREINQAIKVSLGMIHIPEKFKIGLSKAEE